MKWLSLVLAAGLLAAAPFLTSGPVGTAEAYNYNLALADTVTQIRQGTLPVLAGQTEFAFNGRVHPLRTAPYLYYCAGFLDVVTLRQLGFWSLQNLILALSMVGGALSCYWGLRRGTPVAPQTAALLAALYVLSPSVLAAAYGMDLYMTVTTLPFLPVVFAMGLTGQAERKPGDLVKLVAALAACWLAHPPVALWTTTIVALLQFAALIRRPPAWREWPLLLAVALLFVVLAGFSFASALTISPYRDVTKSHDHSLLFQEVSRTFAATLRPVSRTADQLGDFQLGYVVWGLAAVTAGLAILRRHGTALLLLASALLLLAMTTPVPGLHPWLWKQAPAAFFNLTNQWPMQRLYLLITLLLLFAFGLVWRPPQVRAKWAHDGLLLLLTAAVAWTGWQSLRFIGRGFATRQSEEAIRRGHTTGNINLTPISYALLGAPGSFLNGVMDPAFEFRLLAPYDTHEVSSNWNTPLPAHPDSKRGTFTARAGEKPEILELSQRLTLQPGARYRLTFNFLVPPANAILQLRGPSLFRQYPFPAAGGPRGFGMLPGNNRSLTLWTAQDTPEEITLRVVGPGLTSGPWAGRRFAEFAFERIDPAALPIRLESLHPLRVKVTAAADGYLETPRMFIPGYQATVNGRPVRVQRSLEGLLMLPISAGESHVELDYVGPPIARAAFWAGLAGWIGLGLCASVAGWRPAWATRIRTLLQPSRSTRWIIAATVSLGVLGVLAWHPWSARLPSAGPVKVRFVLPRDGVNRQQPLVVTGKPHAGLFVYVVYQDAEHVRLGVDVWGLWGEQTGPIRADYFGEHEVVVDAGSLYPRDLPLAEDTRRRLDRRLRVSFNGATVIDRDISTHASTPDQVTIGRNLIGGSSCEPVFAGEILSVERLPVPVD